MPRCRSAMIGLGRMGANMVAAADARRARVRRLRPRRRRPSRRSPARARPAPTRSRTSSRRLDAPRAVWMMLPAGVVDAALDELLPQLDAGDVVVDGGNSHSVDDLDRASEPPNRACTTSTAASAAASGASRTATALMAGGETEAIAPARRRCCARSRRASTPPRARPGATAPPAPEEEGWLHCGPAGTGHFVKMVHNGIEYGLMEAYAEGLNLLGTPTPARPQRDARRRDRAAERPRALPLRDRRRRRSPRCGGAAPSSRSWLLDLAARGAARGPRARRLLGPRLGLRRGPLDGARGDRRPARRRRC